MAKTADHQTTETKYVAVPIHPNHPLLKLKAVLPWTQLINITEAAWGKYGKNVNHGKGKKWNTELYSTVRSFSIKFSKNGRTTPCTLKKFKV